MNDGRIVISVMRLERGVWAGAGEDGSSLHYELEGKDADLDAVLAALSVGGFVPANLLGEAN